MRTGRGWKGGGGTVWNRTFEKTSQIKNKIE